MTESELIVALGERASRRRSAGGVSDARRIHTATGKEHDVVVVALASQRVEPARPLADGYRFRYAMLDETLCALYGESRKASSD